MQDEDLSTTAVNFIRFHGLTLLVVAHQGTEYLDFKHLVDGIGLDWRTQKTAIQASENAEIYESKLLYPPQIGGAGGASPPKERLHIQLDRAHFFIARISLGQLRARGNHAVADYLRALYREWAEALHAYETHGVAIKSGRNNAVDEALRLHKAKSTAKHEDRAWIDHLLRQQLRELGIPESLLASPQGELSLTTD